MAAPLVSQEVLRTLHRIHRQLSDLRARLDRCPKMLVAAEANVAHRQSLVEAAKTEDKNYRIALDQKQLQLKSSEAKIKELEVKRNQSQSNREYQTLTEQIQATEMANSVLADEILEAMEETDKYKKAVAQADVELAAAKQKFEQVKKEVGESMPLLQTDKTRLEAELEQIETSLPAEVREPYQRVVRQKGEDALAAVDNQCCGGCCQQIPLNLWSQVLSGHPVFCKTCGRMLYTPETGTPTKF